MTIKNYIQTPRPREVRAVLFDGTNGDEVREVLNGPTYTIEPNLYGDGKDVLVFDENTSVEIQYVPEDYYAVRIKGPEYEVVTLSTKTEFEWDNTEVFNS